MHVDKEQDEAVVLPLAEHFHLKALDGGYQSASCWVKHWVEVEPVSAAGDDAGSSGLATAAVESAAGTAASGPGDSGIEDRDGHASRHVLEKDSETGAEATLCEVLEALDRRTDYPTTADILRAMGLSPLCISRLTDPCAPQESHDAISDSTASNEEEEFQNPDSSVSEEVGKVNHSDLVLRSGANLGTVIEFYRGSPQARCYDGPVAPEGVAQVLPFDVEVHQLGTGERVVLDTHRLLIPDMAWIQAAKKDPGTAPVVFGVEEEEETASWAPRMFHARLPASLKRCLDAGGGSAKAIADAVSSVWSPTKHLCSAAAASEEGVLQSTSSAADRKGAEVCIVGVHRGCGCVVMHGRHSSGKRAVFVASCPAWYFGGTGVLTCMLRPDVKKHLERLAAADKVDVPDRVSPDAFMLGRCTPQTLEAEKRRAFAVCELLTGPTNLQQAAASACAALGQLRNSRNAAKTSSGSAAHGGPLRADARSLRRAIKRALHSHGLNLRHVGLLYQVLAAGASDQAGNAEASPSGSLDDEDGWEQLLAPAIAACSMPAPSSTTSIAFAAVISSGDSRLKGEKGFKDDAPAHMKWRACCVLARGFACRGLQPIEWSDESVDAVSAVVSDWEQSHKACLHGPGPDDHLAAKQPASVADAVAGEQPRDPSSMLDDARDETAVGVMDAQDQSAVKHTGDGVVLAGALVTGFTSMLRELAHVQRVAGTSEQQLLNRMIEMARTVSRLNDVRDMMEDRQKSWRVQASLAEAQALAAVAASTAEPCQDNAEWEFQHRYASVGYASWHIAALILLQVGMLDEAVCMCQVALKQDRNAQEGDISGLLAVLIKVIDDLHRLGNTDRAVEAYADCVTALFPWWKDNDLCFEEGAELLYYDMYDGTHPVTYALEVAAGAVLFDDLDYNEYCAGLTSDDKSNDLVVASRDSSQLAAEKSPRSVPSPSQLRQDVTTSVLKVDCVAYLVQDQLDETETEQVRWALDKIHIIVSTAAQKHGSESIPHLAAMVRAANRIDGVAESEEVFMLYRRVLSSLAKKGKTAGPGGSVYMRIQAYVEGLLVHREGGKAEVLHGYRDRERRAEEMHGRGSQQHFDAILVRSEKEEQLLQNGAHLSAVRSCVEVLGLNDRGGDKHLELLAQLVELLGNRRHSGRVDYDSTTDSTIESDCSSQEGPLECDDAAQAPYSGTGAAQSSDVPSAEELAAEHLKLCKERFGFASKQTDTSRRILIKVLKRARRFDQVIPLLGELVESGREQHASSGDPSSLIMALDDLKEQLNRDGRYTEAVAAHEEMMSLEASCRGTMRCDTSVGTLVRLLCDAGQVSRATREVLAQISDEVKRPSWQTMEMQIEEVFGAAEQRGQAGEAEKFAHRVEGHFRDAAGLFSNDHQKVIRWTAESLRGLSMRGEAAALVRQFVTDVAGKYGDISEEHAEALGLTAEFFEGRQDDEELQDYEVDDHEDEDGDSTSVEDCSHAGGRASHSSIYRPKLDALQQRLAIRIQIDGPHGDGAMNALDSVVESMKKMGMRREPFEAASRHMQQVFDAAGKSHKSYVRVLRLMVDIADGEGVYEPDELSTGQVGIAYRGLRQYVQDVVGASGAGSSEHIEAVEEQIEALNAGQRSAGEIFRALQVALELAQSKFGVGKAYQAFFDRVASSYRLHSLREEDSFELLLSNLRSIVDSDETGKLAAEGRARDRLKEHMRWTFDAKAISPVQRAMAASLGCPVPGNAASDREDFIEAEIASDGSSSETSSETSSMDSYVSSEESE